ncbi:MBL fold metallo-hydrolase [Moorena sp. SIO3H5]|uniref:MBL fold metallo-hydrolase n=1 Tax=Moorena sp. SIO3H5 TaxID=2607834 RepID=UPI0013B9CDB1|nr:MBL fold metallo-hydrolase [Moorena sp. SIO3H5]NEO68439.1 MBL fold metallo-hydrolase [Moorena sp. SIO3H5]
MSNQHPVASSDQDDRLTCFPYGVGHGAEGVCLLVQMGPHRILLDCGLEDISPLQIDGIAPADLVLCSHAHSDHSQGLLALHQTFPQLPIYASEVTTQLLLLNWPELPPEDILPFCQALPWATPVEFCEGLTAQLFPAGHLPGAAAFLLTYTTRHRTYRLLYTGDFFLSNSRLVEGLSLESLRGTQPDVVIVEGSYGTARHPHRRQQENQLVERIEQAIATNNSVVLPVPTLGLGQEILMLLRSHHNFTGRDLDIWVNGNVAAGCNAYLELLSHFPSSVQNFARHQALFWDERVRPRVRRLDPQQRDAIGKSPCIILTDLNMDWREYWQQENCSWVVLQPEHLKSLDPIDEYGCLKVETYLLAQHGDCLGTTQLIHNLRPQHVIFVHGSPTYLADLAGLEELQNRYHLHTPAAGTLVELPIGDTFIRPALPTETNYEGELHELDTLVYITLSRAITTDPRWQNFADTGLVEARWQGEELVLRGLSQRELLKQGGRAKIPINIECCGNCLYQRGQRCWNPASALYGFKVTLEGYCPVFERIEPLE